MKNNLIKDRCRKYRSQEQMLRSCEVRKFAEECLDDYSWNRPSHYTGLAGIWFAGFDRYESGSGGHAVFPKAI